MLPDWLRYELREKWDGMIERLRLPGLRDWINEHPGAIKTVALVSVFVVVLVAIQQLRPDEEPVVETPNKEWYYDLNTGELFTAESGQTPPIKAPSGGTPEGKKAGVRAYVLSYVYEPNEAERFIGFLETTATEEMLANAPERVRNPSGANKWARGKMIRRVTDAEWVLADTEEGRKIRAEAFATNENGETPSYVLPE